MIQVNSIVINWLISIVVFNKFIAKILRKISVPCICFGWSATLDYLVVIYGDQTTWKYSEMRDFFIWKCKKKKKNDEKFVECNSWINHRKNKLKALLLIGGFDE